MSAADRDSLVSVFLAEASEGLATLHAALHPADGGLPSARSLQSHYIIGHSLKGASALYGFPGVADLAEILEAALERATESESRWPERVALLRDLVGTLRSQIDAIGRGRPEDRALCDRWKADHASALVSAPDGFSAERFPDSYLLPEVDPEVFSYFSPEAQEYLDAIEASLLRLDQAPRDAETIQLLFRTAHTLKGSAYTVGFKAVGDVTHHVEDMIGSLRDGQMPMTPPVADLVFKVVDVVRLLMKRDPRALPQVRQEFASVLQRLERAGKPEPTGAPVAVAAPAPAPAEERAAKQEAGEPKAPAKEGQEGAVIRVSRDRLERLLNLVGELVIGRGRLEQRLLALEHLSKQVLAYRNRMHETVRTFEDKHAFTLPAASGGRGPAGPAELPPWSDFGSLELDRYDDFNILSRRVAEVSADIGEALSQLNASIRRAREDMGQLHQLTLGMRDEIAKARMVPIGTPFTRFRRAVREMARSTGKDVTLVTSGEQTEVDTGVVERLVDPLVHLVRNAVYHGIEPSAVRVARGKPAAGTVFLHAAHRGSAVVIEVEDDGGGLDVEKIKAKAVSLGLLRSELVATLSDAEAYRLIFLPGFSTAEGVGAQAGRGVGMDVVKRTVEAMNGHIDIETERGVGTKFTLSLPLTLLISTALIVRVGTERYAIPLPSIREVVMPKPGAVQEVEGRALLQLEDEAVEVKRLAALLQAESRGADGPMPVVVVRTATGAVGLAVEELLGRQEIVVKSLGTLKPFRESCFSGASIDPEGRVIMVIDVNRLVGGRRAAGALDVSAQAQTAPALLAEQTGGEARPAQLPAADILLIDDSLSVRKFVGRMLEGAGYHVDTAVDGEEGLRKAAATGYRLIITDLEMPKLNGYEVIQALRMRAHTKSTPILVMTTRAGDKHRQMALGVGASGYVTKPVEERALIQEVSQRIGSAVGAKPSS
ncbi:MAG: Hpt domain-containing protein [Nitrospirota bacterium]